MRLLRWLLVLVLAAATAGAVWYWFERPIPVTTVAVRAGTAAEVVYATGVVEPARWAKVQPVLRGRIVELCQKCEGNSVKAGEVLGRLDDSVARAALKELQAREQFARAELDRSVELLSRRVISQQSYDRVQSELAQIQFGIAAASARLDDLVLRAPMDGTILRRDGEIGEIADTGSVLFWIGTEKPLEVVAEINEEDIPRVEAGMLVLLRSDAFPGRSIEGTVARITPKGDPIAKTYRVRISLPDETPLRIGMTVDVNVVVRRVENAMILPRNALEGDRVFVPEPDGHAGVRAIEVGIRGATEVQVLKGLALGDPVIAPIPTELKPGRRVTIREPGSRP